MKKIGLIILIITFIVTVNAETDKKIISYGLYRGIYLDIDSLNNVLESNGFPELNNYCESWGVGSHTIIEDRIVFGVNFYRFYGNSNSNADFKSKVNGHWELFTFGIITGKIAKNIYMYPLVNIGYGSLDVKIIDTTIDSFDEVLNGDPQLDGITLSTSSYILEPGIGFDYFKRTNGINLFIGLRAGYAFSPVNYGWEVNSIAIEGGPETKVQGPYISVAGGIMF